jgi:hypothetical protein
VVSELLVMALQPKPLDMISSSWPGMGVTWTIRVHSIEGEFDPPPIKQHISPPECFQENETISCFFGRAADRKKKPADQSVFRQRTISRNL